MRLSTSSSERVAVAESSVPGAAAKNFFPSALGLLALVLAVPLLAGHEIGRHYRPQPLAPSAAQVDAADRFVSLFGNSRFDAGIDPLALKHQLSSGTVVDVVAYIGGGWDALHFLNLAMLQKDVLRPDRDVVLIEVSPLSLNDADVNNRMGVIRPEAANAVATLPSLPLEMRLDVALGKYVGLYRYRQSVQSNLLWSKWESLNRRLEPLLLRLGLVGAARHPKPFELRTAAGRNWVIEGIVGDRAAFVATNRPRLEHDVGELRFGGYKWEGLTRAVTALRARHIEVYLLELPMSHWLEGKLHATPAWRDFRSSVTRLSEQTGAHFLGDWPVGLSDEALYWDEEHMVAATTEQFTRVLGDRLAALRPAQDVR